MAQKNRLVIDMGRTDRDEKLVAYSIIRKRRNCFRAEKSTSRLR